MIANSCILMISKHPGNVISTVASIFIRKNDLMHRPNYGSKDTRE